MLRNYLTTATRIFLRQKGYSLINILGLSLGLVTSLLIYVYIVDELSYDRFFKDADKIYRVGEFEKFNGTEISYCESGAPLAEAMRRQIPEITSAVRVGIFRDQYVRYEEKAFFEPRFLVADSNFFQFFDYKFIEGDPATCLKGPNKIVITESIARKYFGYKNKSDASPLGKMFDLGDRPISADYKAGLVNGTNTIAVSAIVADPTANTHMKYDMVLSMDSWKFALYNDAWQVYDLHTYFKVNDPGSIPAVEKKLAHFIKSELLPRLEKDQNTSMKEMNERGDAISYFIQPLTSIHLYSNIIGEFEANGDVRYIYIFGAIGLFVILIACANFVNLATARALQRAKEVGIRKAIGAGKAWLIQQFMIESFLYVIVSGIIAMIFFIVLIGPFNDFSGKSLSIAIFAKPTFLLGTALLIVMIALVAGSYPAFYLTSFRPVEVLKGKIASGTQRHALKNSLVVFQFAISMGLIISTAIIYKQLKFIQQQNTGFDRENIIKIQRTGNLGNNTEAFKNELLRHSEFVSASVSNQLPPDLNGTFFVQAEHSRQPISAFYATGDYDYVATMGYKMKSGRFYSREFLSDSMAVVINATCAKLLGVGEDGNLWAAPYKIKIIGIIEDFNFEGLRGKINPLVIMLVDKWNPGEVMAVRIKAGDPAAAVKKAETTWKQFSDLPFQYSFLDEDFNKTFHAEQQMGSLFKIFTGMSIFVACLGLFGLITLTSAQRVKEIGIRKVLGASISQIAYLLSSQLIRLVIVSFIISIPITWYFMNEWLQGFAYQTDFDFLIVFEAGAAGIIIAILTVGYKSLKSAAANPVKSLRSE